MGELESSVWSGTLGWSSSRANVTSSNLEAVFIMHLYIVLHIIVQCLTDQIFSTTVQETGHAGKDNVFIYFIIIHHCDYWHSGIRSSLDLCLKTDFFLA